MLEKPSPQSVLSYWRTSLLDEAKMKISFDLHNAVIVENEMFLKGHLLPEKTKKLRELYSQNHNLQPADSVVAMVGMRILRGSVKRTTEDTKQPTLFAMAMLVNVMPDGRIQPHSEIAPWLSRELLEPSDNEILIGDTAEMDNWIQLNPFQGGTLSEAIAWADKLWDAVINPSGLPGGYQLWEKIAVQPAASTIGMLTTLFQRRFYDSVMTDGSLITPLLTRYLDGGPAPVIVDEVAVWRGTAKTRGTMTSAYGLSPSQGEAITAYCDMKDGDILAVNGPPGTGKTTLLQGIVATELVTRAIAGGQPAVIVGTSTNNQAVTNIIDAMKKVMTTEDSKPWASRWIKSANALGLYFPSKSREKEAGELGYLIASPGQNLMTTEWTGFPERERDPADARASRDAWVTGYFKSFRPGVSPPVRQAVGVDANDESPRYDISLVEEGIRDIQERLCRLSELGRNFAKQAQALNALFQNSGYESLGQIDDAITRCDACLAERKPREEELKSKVVATQVAMDERYAKARDAGEGAAMARSPLETALKQIRTKAQSTDNLAVSLIAALPESGFLLNLLTGKRWSKVERMVVQSGQAGHFNLLMQSQVRSRTKWIKAINHLTAKADEDIIEAQQRLEALKQSQTAQIQTLENAAMNAKRAHDTACKDYDLYVGESYTASGRERERLVKCIRQIISQLEEYRKLAEKTFPASRWSNEFGLIEDQLPWLQDTWTGHHLVLNDFLDRTVRYKLFQLALRYWEGRWVIEVNNLQKALAKKDNLAYPFKSGCKAMEAMYRRWAMLTPLFIVTTASLPKLPICTAKEDNKFVSRYMARFFDLLIVDEAGQIAPYQIVPAMAFSKKAVVVGDVFQIEPVVTTTHAADTGNARRAGVQQYFWDNDGPIDSRVVTAPPGNNNLMGSVMRVVQTGTSHSSPDSLVPGIFLTEHRRCRRDIIEICNELVYQGRLKPMTPEPGKKPPLPPLAWANVNGQTERVGRSQRNLREAEAIARWIVGNVSTWEAFYGKPIDGILAVVTPFAPQRDAITQALARHGRGTANSAAIGRIKVGTVHTLQGAERDIIVFSPTCDRKAGTGFLEGKRSLLNVAISRAVHSFVVIGTMEIFERNPASTLGIVGKSLFSKGEELRNVVGNWAADNELVLRGRRISTVTDHHRILDDALAGLDEKQEIIIVSPFLSESAVSSPQIQASIRNAIARRAVVNIVTRPAHPAARGGTLPKLREILEAAGAKLHDIELLHSKTLLTSSVIVEGSFNWLSVKRENPENANLDTSWLLTGSQAREAARDAIKELNERNALVGQLILNKATPDEA